MSKKRTARSRRKVKSQSDGRNEVRVLIDRLPESASFDAGTVKAAEKSYSKLGNSTTVGDAIVSGIARLVRLRTRKTVKYPANWWEHFKQDCLPIWVQLRWPVRYTEESFWECTFEEQEPAAESAGGF